VGEIREQPFTDNGRGSSKGLGMGEIGISMESDGVLQPVLFIWETWEFW
jgi:hypothetical protein